MTLREENDWSSGVVDPFISESHYDLGMRPRNPFVEFRKEDTEQSISDRFEQQARRYPQRLAVKTKGQRLTYDELNRISNRAAKKGLSQ